MKSLVNALHNIQERMARSKSMFPSHHAHLEERYTELLNDAKSNKITPPWMAA